MPSPLFDVLGNTRQIQKPNNSLDGPIRMMQDFVQFKRNFNGNAKEECMKRLNSGKYTPEQIEQAKGMANQMQSLIGLFMRNKN